MSRRVRLGISTCPNDTFAFHGLLAEKVDRRGLDLALSLHDVQALNEGLAAGRFDAAKASFLTAQRLASEVVVLESGSAVGFGVGPVVLARRGASAPLPRMPRVLAPGDGTTASLLLRAFHPEWTAVEHRVFSAIMPALLSGEADLGVCIHEARFTYEAAGLVLVEDLGRRFEEATGAPLPLGGIAARRALGPEVLDRLAAVVQDSVAYGLAHREECLPSMRRYAQEQDDAVLWAHVDLYVNAWTLELGEPGRRALAAFHRCARAAGDGGARPLEVWAPGRATGGRA